MLSHENVAWTAKTAIDIVGAGEADRCLSYLPLSHIAEQMFTIHAAITGGNARLLRRVDREGAEELEGVRPTFFFAVPRIWEKFHAGISSKLG